MFPLQHAHMKHLVARGMRYAQLVGLNPAETLITMAGVSRYLRDALVYRARARDGAFPIRLGEMYPIFRDRADCAGTSSGHYFHQDLGAAKKIYDARPSRHVDIGSRVDGFVAHLLVFMPVEVIDVRPLTSTLPGLTFVQRDAMSLDGIPSDSVESLSSLHAVEHFGLGRYGDRIDPDGWRRAIGSLVRVLAPGGRFYLSVPIGRERVEFNAHRVFAPDTIVIACGDLELVSFSAVNDAGELEENVRPERYRNAVMACGLFEFTKT
jgi:SAM-dependent methyltransferase